MAIDYLLYFIDDFIDDFIDGFIDGFIAINDV
jgi:hypothetical protein